MSKMSERHGMSLAEFPESNLVVKRDGNRITVSYKGEFGALFWDNDEDKISLEKVFNALQTLKLAIETEDAGGNDKWLQKSLATCDAMRAEAKAKRA